MSGNSQQENTLRKREARQREGERAGFIKSLDNKLAPSDGGKIRREGGREGAERAGAHPCERALFVATKLEEGGREGDGECEWMMCYARASKPRAFTVGRKNFAVPFLFTFVLQSPMISRPAPNIRGLTAAHKTGQLFPLLLTDLLSSEF